MDTIIQKSFDKMISTYKHTLSNFYPARDSTGFTEANQTHIFINALMSNLNDVDAVSWLEFPWEGTQHIDGFVYSPKHRSVFYIEAKRLSNQKKKDEIIRDINRLSKSNHEFLKEHDVVNVDKKYAVALSDVWLEGSWKKAMPEWWCGIDNVPSQVLGWEKRMGEKLTETKNTICAESSADWSKSFRTAFWLGDSIKSVKNYCLLMAAIKL